jgi:hypothetical protein
VVIASLVRRGLEFLGGMLLPFTTFYPVVLFSTYFGGPRVSVFASIVGGVVGWWAFLLPHVGFFPIKISGELELLTYAVACALIIWGADSYRRLAKRLREEERLRMLAVEELNKAAFHSLEINPSRACLAPARFGPLQSSGAMEPAPEWTLCLLWMFCQ